MQNTAKVLLADANEEFRTLLAGAIRETGEFTVVGSTGDGLEALRLAEEQKPDLLILDTVLPGLDGFGILRRLPELGAPKAIVLSGYFSDRAVAEALELGAAYYLTKPCQMDALLERMRAAVHREEEARPQTTDLRSAVTEIIHEIGVPAHIKGYQYLRQAIILTVQDMELINDIGANAVRSATGPHSQYFYDCCDRNGTLVWIDTPFTRAPFLSDVSYFATNRFRNNGLQQLREIIIQNYNHPSVVMWGISSLVWERGDNVLEFLRQLNSTAKTLDPSRPTVACSNQDGDINFVSDMIVWQQDLGWERGTIDDINVWREKLHADWGNLRSAVAYGAPGSIEQQSDEAVKPARIDPRWLPERWQTEFHEGYARNILSDSLFWGVWINNMFEFGSVRYTDGIAHAGLVTFDRKDRKDAYYLYRALWNRRSPTLHITEKRRNMRQDTIQQVKFYSSAAEAPVLTVNKDTIPTRQIAPCQFISDSVVMKGRNEIVVRAGDLSDRNSIVIVNALKQHQ